MISYYFSMACMMLTYFLMQISMNVQQELSSVSKFAITPLVLTHATVTVGLSLMPMEEHVMVSTSNVCEL